MVYAKVVNGLGRLRSKLQFRANFLKLAADKTYIFPTGFGFAFGILSFILLVMAIGYGNNILYFFVFLLVSMGLSTAWLTNNNVDAIRVSDVQTSLVFANEENAVLLKVRSGSKKNNGLWDMDFRVEDKNFFDKQFYQLSDVEDSGEVVIKWRPLQRGMIRYPRIMMQSKFPFKLLRAWKYDHKQNSLIVYPERKGKLNLVTLMGKQDNRDEAAKIENEGLFRDYREFQNSDSPNRIDWKRSIKHQKHLVKNLEKSGDRKIIIDWEFTEELENFEQRVSQMALWVDLCYQKNETYSLKIKNYQSEYFASLNHYKASLEKLALLTPEDVA
ncbi:MAG: DUF58 domain-containing protein [Pseudobdellovibrio sp.]